MLHLRRWLAYPLVFLLSLAWFSVYQPWGGFNDPDAFYHAKIASVMSERGPLHAFPSMDLTFFDKAFTDHHILFHVLLIPFVRAFGMFTGNQVAAVVFAAGFLTVLYAVLRRLRVAHPELWAVLAAAATPLLIRLSLAKASPLALACFVLGLFAVLVPLMKGEEKGGASTSWQLSCLAILVGLGYSLSHGGWIIVLVGQGLLFLGSLLVDKIVLDRSWRQAVLNLPWRIPVLTFAGALIGLFIHPNFPANIFFLKTLLIDISLKVPFAHVRLGDEWQPSTVMELWGGLSTILVVGGLVGYGLIFAARQPIDKGRMKQVVGLGLITALFLALTFKSRRAIEYLVPSLILWLATLWTCVDAQRCINDIWHHWKRVTGKWATVVTGILVGAVLVIHGYNYVTLWKTFRNQVHPFYEYAPAMQAIAARAFPNDRVFHSDWDEFPELWALNDRVRYIVGLDPTLLWLSNPSLSDAYRDIATGKMTEDVYENIQNLFGARFVFLERKQHHPFEKVLKADPRFKQLYEDEITSSFELVP